MSIFEIVNLNLKCTFLYCLNFLSNSLSPLPPIHQVPQGLKVDSISETSVTLKWNYTKLTDVHHGFLVTVSSISAITFKSHKQLLNSTVLEGERPEYLHLIDQLAPGQTYEINLAVVIQNRTGPDVKIFASTLQQGMCIVQVCMCKCVLCVCVRVCVYVCVCVCVCVCVVFTVLYVFVHVSVQYSHVHMYS